MSQQDTYIPGAIDSAGGRGHRRKKQLRVSYLFFLGIAAVILTKLDPDSLHIYSFGAMGLLTLKMLGALFYRPARPDREDLLYLDQLWVTAVIPIYNEDPVMFEQGMRSVLAQSRLPNEIHIIDDASANPSGIKVARRLKSEFEALGVKFTVSVQPQNKGKREALALGFEAAPYSDIFLCVDSDTVLSRDTFRELLLPLADDRVMASTGMVLALNHDSNIFTRLQDLRYGNSFLFERAAYSRLKSVLCCCGALSAYRGSLVRKYLPDFLNQQFLGKPAVFGDDRRMTNYCLMEGQVVFQETAVGYTAVPEKLPHFLRQQVRWNKSFFRESLWAFVHQKKYRPAFWLTCMELALWLVFGSAMFYSMVILPALHPERFLNHLGDYLVFMVLMGYLRNVRYLDFPRRGMGFIRRFGMFLLAPLYGVIQLLLLTPLRFYALLTLGQGSWGTRQGGVEVSVAGHEDGVSEVWEEEDPYSDPRVTSTIEMMRLEGLALQRTMPHHRPGVAATPVQGYGGHTQSEMQELGRSAPPQPVTWNAAVQPPVPQQGYEMPQPIRTPRPAPSWAHHDDQQPRARRRWQDEGAQPVQTGPQQPPAPAYPQQQHAPQYQQPGYPAQHPQGPAQHQQQAGYPGQHPQGPAQHYPQPGPAYPQQPGTGYPQQPGFTHQQQPSPQRPGPEQRGSHQWFGDDAQQDAHQHGHNR
ncbi:glycosyltransferase [Streptomyces sp. NPDC051940]|uniref:glycosyltransferase n=1 Tax=Streptomyces sp. NPDC051940 TaxID=3155675 RepID=UPI0034363F87